MEGEEQLMRCLRMVDMVVIKLDVARGDHLIDLSVYCEPLSSLTNLPLFPFPSLELKDLETEGGNSKAEDLEFSRFLYGVSVLKFKFP